MCVRDEADVSHLELARVLFPLDLPPGQVEPGTATQGRRDALLTTHLHLGTREDRSGRQEWEKERGRDKRKGKVDRKREK